MRILCSCCLVTQLCSTFSDPWTVAHQAALSMEFPDQEYCSGLPFPSLGDLHNPGIKPASPAFEGRFFPSVLPGKPFGRWKEGLSPDCSSLCNALQRAPSRHFRRHVRTPQKRRTTFLLPTASPPCTLYSLDGSTDDFGSC